MNRRTQLSVAASLALTALFASPPVAAQAPASLETGFLNGQVTASGTTMRYVVYVPWDYSPEKQWPVILFMHGSGEEGTDGLRQVVGGLAQQILWNSKRFPCLVVLPQTNGGTWNCAAGDLALQALDDVVAK